MKRIVSYLSQTAGASSKRNASSPEATSKEDSSPQLTAVLPIEIHVFSMGRGVENNRHLYICKSIRVLYVISILINQVDQLNTNLSATKMPLLIVVFVV